MASIHRTTQSGHFHDSTAAERPWRQLFGRPVTRWTLVAALAGAIFIADTVTDLEIAFAVLYVAVILISVRSGNSSAVPLVGAVCGLLTVLSFALSKEGALAAGLANCALSLVAIGATTLLAIRIEAASAATRQAQANLAHLSRVMTMSELTTSIAHEVSQPLAAIVANSGAAIRWLSRSPPSLDEARVALDRVAKDADRAGIVIARIRHLVRRMPPLRERADLAALVVESLGMLRDRLRASKVVLRTEMPADIPAVIGDGVQLQQVILNMVINAIEALDGVAPEARELTVGVSTKSRHVIVSVADCGIGVPPEAADRIFEAFYSTKPNGMGVGLAVSRSIVDAHGGTMRIAANRPRGTVASFAVPQDRTSEG